MEHLVVSLLAWIAVSTGLSADPPAVLLVPEHEMREIYYGNHGPKSLRLAAFYHHPTSTVFLPQGWSGGDLGEQSVLLHELVHHVQRTNGVQGVPCELALERQAYDLQVQWLTEQGVANPYDILGSDAFSITFLTACMND